MVLFLCHDFTVLSADPISHSKSRRDHYMNGRSTCEKCVIVDGKNRPNCLGVAREFICKVKRFPYASRSIFPSEEAIIGGGRCAATHLSHEPDTIVPEVVEYKRRRSHCAQRGCIPGQGLLEPRGNTLIKASWLPITTYATEEVMHRTTRLRSEMHLEDAHLWPEDRQSN